MGGFLVSPFNCACPPTASPPGDYVTRWRIDPVTGCWWLMDQTIPAFSIPCPTQLSSPNGLSGGGGYGTIPYGAAEVNGLFGTPSPTATYTNSTGCNQLVYYAVGMAFDMRLNNTHQASGFSRISYSIQLSNDGGGTWTTSFRGGKGATGLAYDYPTYNAAYSQIVTPGATFRVAVRLWWGNPQAGSSLADVEVGGYVVGIPMFSLSQLPT